MSTTLKTTLFQIGSIRLLGRYVDARFAASGLAPHPTASRLFERNMGTTIQKLRVKTAFLCLLASLGLATGNANSVVLYAPYPETGPTQSFETYAKGNIGVLAQGYSTVDLLVAYRVLTGHKLSDAEIRILSTIRKNWYDYNGSYFGSDWLSVRQTLPHEKALERAYATNFGPCRDNAFSAATSKLKQLFDRFGSKDAAVLEWVRGQDAVFSHCWVTATATRPQELPEFAPQWLKKERAYQIAASALYEGDFPKARTFFRQIGRDKDSPWNNYAPYLIGRSYLEQADNASDEERQTVLKEAFSYLETQKPTSKEDKARLRQLVRRAQYALAPEAELARMETAIGEADWGPEIQQDLNDYFYSINRDLSGYKKPRRRPVLDAVGRGGLTDWLYTVQGIEQYPRKLGEDFNGVVGQWRKTRSDAWLVAALMNAKALSETPQDLLDAAASVKPGAAAYAAAQYNLLRLQHEDIQTSRRPDVDTKQLDATFASDAQRLLSSSWKYFPGRDANLLHQFIALHTDNACTFVQNAWMYASAEGGGSGASGFPGRLADAMNTKANLDTLVKFWSCSRNSQSEAHKELTSVVWLRAVILGRSDVVRLLTPEFKALYNKDVSHIDAFLSESGSKKGYALAQLLLANEDLKAYLSDMPWKRYGSLVHASDFSSFSGGPVLFQDDASLDEAHKEAETLGTAEKSVTYVGDLVLTYVRSHPFDLSNPATLASLVSASRGADALPVSRAAFRILNHWYWFTPSSRHTKYYY
ncbi:hypothetical protein N5I87_15570 [Ralstonia sp. CHL-2022]|uniref:Uncharacterized protein n=1 Tax=Ralstonia mojiangensis TaxID=2953895 RepID=A0AAE3I5T1_9RALS|nr:hypothetical protein [Ralstonia mojiangensis]MCT7317426.1 hypothetical protein [Ralstonia mojiangensis]